MRLNVSNNLFLGEQEIKHFQKSLGDEGFRRLIKTITKTYGIVDTFNNDQSLKIFQGSATGFIKIQAGSSIDENLNIAYLDSDVDNVLEVTDDDTWRYIAINYFPETREKGTCSISASGVVTGVGTEFTKLRAMPEFSSVIEFESSNNTARYRILSIASDTSMQLNVPANSLTNESLIRYSVIGTFTPGYSPSVTEVKPFKYDSYELSTYLNLGSVPNNYYVLARIKRNASTVSIEDHRYINMYSMIKTPSKYLKLPITNSDYFTLIESYIDESSNNVNFYELNLPNSIKTIEIENDIDNSAIFTDLGGGTETYRWGRVGLITKINPYTINSQTAVSDGFEIMVKFSPATGMANISHDGLSESNIKFLTDDQIPSNSKIPRRSDHFTIIDGGEDPLIFASSGIENEGDPSETERFFDETGPQPIYVAPRVYCRLRWDSSTQRWFEIERNYDIDQAVQNN